MMGNAGRRLPFHAVANSGEEPPELRYGAPEPLSRQIAEWLARRIEAGVYEPARDMLPSEKTLQDMFGVSRPTVRIAYRLLRDAGLAYTIPQRGTYVPRMSARERAKALERLLSEDDPPPGRQRRLPLTVIPGGGVSYFFPLGFLHALAGVSPDPDGREDFWHTVHHWLGHTAAHVVTHGHH